MRSGRRRSRARKMIVWVLILTSWVQSSVFLSVSLVQAFEGLAKKVCSSRESGLRGTPGGENELAPGEEPPRSHGNRRRSGRTAVPLKPRREDHRVSSDRHLFALVRFTLFELCDPSVDVGPHFSELLERRRAWKGVAPMPAASAKSPMTLRAAVGRVPLMAAAPVHPEHHQRAGEHQREDEQGSSVHLISPFGGCARGGWLSSEPSETTRRPRGRPSSHANSNSPVSSGTISSVTSS